MPSPTSRSPHFPPNPPPICSHFFITNNPPRLSFLPSLNLFYLSVHAKARDTLFSNTPTNISLPGTITTNSLHILAIRIIPADSHLFRTSRDFFLCSLPLLRSQEQIATDFRQNRHPTSTDNSRTISVLRYYRFLFCSCICPHVTFIFHVYDPPGEKLCPTLFDTLPHYPPCGSRPRYDVH